MQSEFFIEGKSFYYNGMQSWHVPATTFLIVQMLWIIKKSIHETKNHVGLIASWMFLLISVANVFILNSSIIFLSNKFILMSLKHETSFMNEIMFSQHHKIKKVFWLFIHSALMQIKYWFCDDDEDDDDMSELENSRWHANLIELLCQIGSFSFSFM